MPEGDDAYQQGGRQRPRVWYHQKLTRSNVSVFLDILNEKYPPSVEGKPEEKEPEEKVAKPVVIDYLLVEKGCVGVKIGAEMELPLPAIELKDIGKDGAMVPGQVAVLLARSVVKGVMRTRRRWRQGPWFGRLRRRSRPLRGG